MVQRAPVTFFQSGIKLAFPRYALQRAADAIFQGENIRVSRSVNCILCSDAAIRRLNRNFRRKDRPTDVLSFPFEEERFLGEIYISLQRVKVQARRYRHSYTTELVRLFVHGMIHLLGYDHLNKIDRDAMEAIERKYCPVL